MIMAIKIVMIIVMVIEIGVIKIMLIEIGVPTVDAGVGDSEEGRPDSAHKDLCYAR